ncbi:MAG: glutamine--fructose-6-phosphate transaminase (isomerizing) [Candidatus Bathyarchaeia archaeon]
MVVERAMCGIIGCVLGEGSAAPLIYQALKRLEYRGYDSAGIATVHGGLLYVEKDAGRIDDINRRIRLEALPGSMGIGHTRWATHGAPTKENAHPHVDCRGLVAVVHNGVIENFQEVKGLLMEKGHRYVSRTDTESVAHLVEEELIAGDDLYRATLKGVRRIRGSYALAVISPKEPDKIICARNESPLIIGVSGGGVFCASDIPAILPYTNEVAPLGDGEIAILKPGGFEIRRISDDTPVKRAVKVLDWTFEIAEKHGYPHFMLKEIHEQPISLRNALRLQGSYLDLAATFLDRGEEVFLIGSGTSYHACLAASYMFSKLARLTTYPVRASEFIEKYGDTVGIESLVLALSQSGETYDVLRAVDHARMKAATVLGVTNIVGSTLTRVSRAYLVQQSGPEIGVAATKTFTAQLIVLAQLALRLARIRGKLSQDEIDELKENLNGIPGIIEQVIRKREDDIKLLAREYSKKGLFLFLGRGISSATAMEGGLKLLEITYVPALSYPAGESKHGPISLVEDGIPAVFICPRDETRKEILGNVMELKARGADIIVLCEEGDKELVEEADRYVEMSKGIAETLSPIPYIVPLQLFAYYMAVEKGLDPDKPRNLAKSVTVP